MARRNESTTESSSLGERLRNETTGVSLTLRAMGIRRKFNREQNGRVADAFDADIDHVAATKRLLSRSVTEYTACKSALLAARATWVAMTVPYTEGGTRLIKRATIERFVELMEAHRATLTEKVEALQECWDDLVAAERDRLGDLYDPSEYPDASSLPEFFAIEWSFPSLAPPDFLKKLHPDLWQQEQRRIAARFEEAVSLAQAAFIEEFGKLVAHMAEKLGSGEDGKPQIFRDSTVNNLKEFFERFRQLNVGGVEDLDRLVNEAESLVDGADLNALRNTKDDAALKARQRMQKAMSEIAAKTDAMMINKPRRRFVLDDAA